jgi:hypothetical protein
LSEAHSISIWDNVQKWKSQLPKKSRDIANFVEAEVTRLIDKKRFLNGRVPPKLKKKIIRILTEQAQGMFRWVSMSLETLAHIEHVEDFKAALGKLPPTL